MVDKNKFDPLRFSNIHTVGAATEEWDIIKVPYNEIWEIDVCTARREALTAAINLLVGVTFNNTFIHWFYLLVPNNNNTVNMHMPLMVFPGDIVHAMVTGAAANDRLRTTISGKIYRITR